MSYGLSAETPTIQGHQPQLTMGWTVAEEVFDNFQLLLMQYAQNGFDEYLEVKRIQCKFVLEEIGKG